VANCTWFGIEKKGTGDRRPGTEAAPRRERGERGEGGVALLPLRVSRIFGVCALFGVAALATVGVTGCGYRLVGYSSNLPTNLSKLYVAHFVNQSTRAELDQRLTEQITQEWVRRGRFQLVSQAEQADAVLSGTITSAATTAVRFDELGRASEYQMIVTADVQLVDRTGEKPVTLWHDARFSRSMSYQIDVNAANYFDREVEAMERLARDFARGLVVTILEGF
jgi:outer membrane lipopolysaccharide assembly protein LptE/RlpB